MSSDQTGVNPHDALFRRVLGEPEHAASQLRSVLPPALTERLEMDRLTPVPGSFVDEELRWRHCDLLFSTTTSGGHDALVYLLMEHQSTPDPWMAWRMMRYVMRIWDRYRTEHPTRATLPLVVPVVVYHGRVRWRRATEVGELVDLDPAWAADPGTAELVPRFRFLLDDLSVVDEKMLRARPLTAPARVTLFLLGRATAPGLARALAEWVVDLRAVLDRPGGRATFEALMTYIQLVADGSAESLRPVLEDVGPDAEEAYVTIAEQLRAEGEARGEARGTALGEARGRAAALLQLLELRFGPLPAATADTVRAAPVERVETWTAQVLTAATLRDALR